MEDAATGFFNPPSLQGEMPFDKLRALSKRSAPKRLAEAWIGAS
jgi:hypothetical protein